MRITNVLLVILIGVLYWNGLPKKETPELVSLRVEEAAKIVELYENRVQDAELDVQTDTLKRDALKVHYDSLDRIHGAVSERAYLEVKHQYELAEVQLKVSQAALKEVQLELDLTRIRLRAAHLDPDDFTIYVDQRTKR